MPAAAKGRRSKESGYQEDEAFKEALCPIDEMSFLGSPWKLGQAKELWGVHVDGGSFYLTHCPIDHKRGSQ